MKSLRFAVPLVTLTALFAFPLAQLMAQQAETGPKESAQQPTGQVTLSGSNSGARTLPAGPQKFDFSKLSANKFVAKVQLLLHEARSFESSGDLKTAFQLASRAESILLAAQQYSHAPWPKEQMTPTEYIGRLRRTARQGRKSVQPIRLAESAKQARKAAQQEATKQSVGADSEHSPRPKGVASKTQTSVAQQAIAEEPRLLLEQLDGFRQGSWQPVEEPTGEEQSKIVNANISPFQGKKAKSQRSPANKTPGTSPPALLDQKQSTRPIGTGETDGSENPFLQQSQSTTHPQTDKTPSQFELASVAPAVDQNDKGLLFPSAAVTDSKSGSECSDAQDTPRFDFQSQENSDPPRAAIAPPIPTDTESTEPAQSKTDHGHQDSVWLGVAVGIGATVGLIWLLRTLIQLMFGMKMEITVRGKVVPTSKSDPNASGNQPAVSSGDELKADSDSESVAVTNDSMKPFPFRVVGTDSQSDSSATAPARDEENAEKLVSSLVDENVKLQDSDRKVA